MNEPKMPTSDAAWYCRKDPEADRFYEILFKMCRKYHVSWCSASEKERLFIEEVSRVTYERDRATVPSRFMRKKVCRLRLNEVSRQ